MSSDDSPILLPGSFEDLMRAAHKVFTRPATSARLLTALAPGAVTPDDLDDVLEIFLADLTA